MEPNRTIIFSVICNDENYLNQIINWYNNNHKTNFKIVRLIEDEVNFVDIEVSIFDYSDLFNLGYHFGAKEQRLRDAGKIDW